MKRSKYILLFIILVVIGIGCSLGYSHFKNDGNNSFSKQEKKSDSVDVKENEGSSDSGLENTEQIVVENSPKVEGNLGTTDNVVSNSVVYEQKTGEQNSQDNTGNFTNQENSFNSEAGTSYVITYERPSNSNEQSIKVEEDVTSDDLVEDVTKQEEVLGDDTSLDEDDVDVDDGFVLVDDDYFVLEVEEVVESENTASSIVNSKNYLETSNDTINRISDSKENLAGNSDNNSGAKKVVTKNGVLAGSTGYSALNSKKSLRKKASNNSAAILTLKGGYPFLILSASSDGSWWKVNYNGKIGYVESAYCLINLPDYIPSITYKITNASESIYQSSGVKLSVYGKKLYNTGKVYNKRLSRNEYIVPVVYSFAKKILKAQKSALADGYSLKIYDAYRPVSVANTIKNSLNSLYNSNASVRRGIDYSADGNSWGSGWFIAQNLSAHSLASAIDVTLTKKGHVTNVAMPTRVHELSTKAIKYRYGVAGQTTVRNDLYASSMNENAKRLDRYMMNAGMTSLASEWWHFQDNVAYNRIKAYEGSGLNFQPSKIVSVVSSN